MKRWLSIDGKSMALAAVLLLLLGVFAFVALRSGPLAPVPVTLITVESRAVAPAVFGIGNVEARYTHKIGPTFAGRLRRVEVEQGDRVKAGQLLGEMDPVDLDDRIGAQDAALRRAEAGIAAEQAQVQESTARKTFAETQAARYDTLGTAQVASAESIDGKRQEAQIARAALSAVRANLEASRQERERVRAERDGLVRQRANLRLLAPTDGLVSRREADPGTTVVAGQTVIEVVEPGSIWIHVRFDQQRALGLRAQLSARIVLRSQPGEPLAGRVSRVESHADSVTEETLAKVEFVQIPRMLPPLGELAEVTVALAEQKPMPVVPNASVQRVDGRLGVWVVEDDNLRFAPITTGAADLDGRVQVLEGLSVGERVVVYSQKTLVANSRIKVVDRIVPPSP
ncbi:MAG: efflux RND transporter periplasmic adaptor subunit [Vicinamibacteria bacterium]|jgi:HlyD family secretion protein|nr:efflux RND transporter periplasmic adaptor subunit [Vicinamibacteria bacterium]